MRALFSHHPMWSHAVPMVPLARAMRRAGHEVAFASGPGFELLAKHDFAMHAVGPSWERDPEIKRLLVESQSYAGPEHARFMLREVFAGSSGLRCVPDQEALMADWRPDVVITETTDLAAAAVAERLEIPYAIVTFGVDIPVPILKVLAGDARDALRRTAGLAADPEFAGTHRYLRLNFAPPSYQPLATPVSHAVRPAMFDDAEQRSLPDWIEAPRERPIVYATLGTFFAHESHLLDAIVEGLRDEEIELVITVSEKGDPTRFDRCAENVHAAHFIPNSLLLPHCSALVSHAGYGTVMGALTFGTPMLLMPLGADHFLHANRCRDLGVAEILPREEVVAERVRTGVRAMLDDRASSPRDAIRDEIATLPGLDHAVGLVEQLADTRAPVFRVEES